MSDSAEGAVRAGPLVLLRLEAAALLGAAVLAYAWSGHSWWLFRSAFLAPALLAGLGALAGASLAVPLAVIWAAHIGFDRLLGYGLKYGGGFGHTHLGTLGRRAP